MPIRTLRFRFVLPGGELAWSDLLAKRRVVILAEAGSGKSVEMEGQARLLAEAGRLAFCATVEDMGADGLECSLSVADRAKLAIWRTSNEPAWFFIDAVDEAKQIGMRLAKAIRRLGEGIAGADIRAHIVLSGRITDWEFRRDLACLKDGLAIPNDLVLPPPPTANEALISTIRHDRREGHAPTVEQPLIVLMAPLDPERVRLFAAAKGAKHVDAFWRRLRLPISGALQGGLWTWTGSYSPGKTTAASALWLRC